MSKALPSPSVWAVLFLVTVPVAILSDSRVLEVALDASMVFLWVEIALPVLGAVAAARWTAQTGRRRSGLGFGSAVLVATLVGAVYVTLAAVMFSWIIPLGDAVRWREFLMSPAAAVGGAVGYGLGLRSRDRGPGSYRYVVGAALAALGGYLIFPTTDVGVRHGGHTFEHDLDPHTVHPTTKTRYGIFRQDGLDTTPDCRITGPGLTDEPMTPLTIPVNNSHDATTAFVVAIVSVPSGGTYTTTCNIADYTIQPIGRGAPPVIRTWPVPVIVALGAVPGLVIMGDTARRRLRRSKLVERSESAR